MGKIKNVLKNAAILFLAMVCALNVFASVVTVNAAIPSISTSRYIKGYVLSNSNNTPVYTSSSLKTRGTSSPKIEYSTATIYANDEIYIYSMNDTFAYISYPTSSGRRRGYISTASVTSNNYSQNAVTCKATTTTYKRAGGEEYGSVFKGDTVYTVAVSGSYTQIVYNVSGGYKLGWVKTSDYNKNIKSAYNPQGYVDSISSNAYNQITLKGWCFDRDSLNSNIQIHVYVGGPAGSGAPCYVITANKYRSDVNKAYGVGNNHGFDSTITVSKTGKQTVYVYGINVGGGNSNPLIGTKTVDIKSKPENRPISDGVYNIISAGNKNMAIDMFNANKFDCSPAILFTKHDGTNQQVEIKYAGNDYYTIKFVHSGKYLDVEGGRAANGIRLIQYSYHGGNNQLWKIIKNSDDTYSIQSKLGNYFVDVNGGVFTDRQKIQIWVGNNSVAQKFYFQSVKSAETEFDPIWPCEKTYVITTLYKYSKGGIHSCRFRYGIDIGASKGENVLAIESGKVIRSEYDTISGFGNYIMIQHLNGKVSLYAHLNSRKVNVGTTVSKGQIIGQVGNTSKYSISPHLHFELGNSNKLGADGDAYQEYYKSKYSNRITLTQAAKIYNTP